MHAFVCWWIEISASFQNHPSILVSTLHLLLSFFKNANFKLFLSPPC